MKKFADKMDSVFGLKGYAIGFACCAAVSFAVFAITLFAPLAFFYFYIILIIPFAFFSFMLNRKIIKDRKLHNRFADVAVKLIASLLIWFVALFPFSLFGVQSLIGFPGEIAKSREAAQLREEIMNSETYADLTPFGLGVYKLKNAGDRYLWDITQPKDRPDSFEGALLVFEYFRNERDFDSFDPASRGEDVMYDVRLYEGTYIIIPPPEYNYIYLCKGLDKGVDIFWLRAIDADVKVKLLDLPGENYSKKELSEKLGKDMG